MRLYINEKIISIHNKYFIKDEKEKDILEISSKIISLGRKTWIKDLSGNELVYVEQELFHLMPHYNIYIHNNKICSIKKKFKLLKNDYELSNHYHVEGNFINHSFIIYNDKGNKIGQIKRKYISIGDQYIIDIDDENEYLLVLAIIVAIANEIESAQNAVAASSSN